MVSYEFIVQSVLSGIILVLLLKILLCGNDPKML